MWSGGRMPCPWGLVSMTTSHLPGYRPQLAPSCATWFQAQTWRLPLLSPRTQGLVGLPI